MIYKSEAFEVIYNQALSLYKLGLLSDSKLDEYEALCLVQDIKLN